VTPPANCYFAWSVSQWLKGALADSKQFQMRILLGVELAVGKFSSGGSPQRILKAKGGERAMRLRAVSLLIVALSLGPSSFAKKEQAPLSASVIAAKTAYVENHGSAKLKDRSYDELKKWGRWVIVEDRTKADLVIVLSSEEEQSSTGQTQTYDPNMKTGTMTTGGWKYGTETSTTSGSIHLELLDSKTGESLFADTRGNVHIVIAQLRKRIDKQKK
jgi:hypothetical protein